MVKELEFGTQSSETMGLLSSENSDNSPTHSSCLTRCWEFFRCTQSTDLENRTVIEYRFPISECWGHTWEKLKKTESVMKECCHSLLIPARICGLTFATIAYITCLATCALGAMYWASYGMGVAFNEITSSHQYFGDKGNSAFAQYFATPGIGFALLIAPFALCALLCLGSLAGARTRAAA